MDPITRTMIRDEVESIINPLNLYAIESANPLRDEQDGKVTALSMGLPGLEENTLPGKMPTSLLPQEAAAIGNSFSELCDTIAHASLSAYRNADGGFSHAIEPDAWKPCSSPLQT